MNELNVDKGFKHKYLELLKQITRIAIGLLFVVSAILKLISVNEFELYIYSFNIVGFSFSAILARLIISFELLCGILFITRFYFKKIWWLLFSTTIGFTLLLIYIAIFRDDSNCHCMGAFVELNPGFSILKNVGILVAMIFTLRTNESTFRRRKILSIIASFVIFLLPNILYPSDVIYRYLFNEQRIIDVNAFNEYQNDTVTNLPISNIIKDENLGKIKIEIGKGSYDISDGTFLIIFVHSGCEYCTVAMKKVRLIFESHNLCYDKCIVFISGDNEHICEFIQKTGTEKFKFRLIDPFAAVKITSGKFPTLSVFKDGEVIEVLDYMAMNEDSLIDYFRE